MHNQDLILGIDTSNYTTSLALTNKYGEIFIDSRKPLMVKQGERGLRQSSALFQHMENLPDMLLDIFRQVDKSRIAAVVASNMPRPVEGSYMPVFRSGMNYGNVVAGALGIPFLTFSHQEGHLEAIRNGCSRDHTNQFLAYHLSGGTSELLKVSMLDNAYDKIEIIGGSKDISFGQLIDRVGVARGLSFPAGKELDQRAIEDKNKNSEMINQIEKSKLLTPIKLDGLFTNLSGIETQCLRNIDNPYLVIELFTRIAECLCKLTEKAYEETGIHDIIFAGGVSSSQFIMNRLKEHFKEKDVLLTFGNPKLASDNAVGISLLGGKVIWQLNQ